MADTNAWIADTHFTAHRQPGETIFNTWLRGLDDRPHGHCGPIYIQ